MSRGCLKPCSFEKSCTIRQSICKYFPEPFFEKTFIFLNTSLDDTCMDLSHFFYSQNLCTKIWVNNVYLHFWTNFKNMLFNKKILRNGQTKHPSLSVSIICLMKQGRKLPIVPWQNSSQLESVQLNFNGCSFQISKM